MSEQLQSFVDLQAAQATDQARLKEHAKWHGRVNTVNTEIDLENGRTSGDVQKDAAVANLSGEDVAYEMWLKENAADEHAGNSTRQSMKDREEDRSKELLREKARLNMRVKTGVATPDEVAYNMTLEDEGAYQQSNNPLDGIDEAAQAPQEGWQSEDSDGGVEDDSLVALAKETFEAAQKVLQNGGEVNADNIRRQLAGISLALDEALEHAPAPDELKKDYQSGVSHPKSTTTETSAPDPHASQVAIPRPKLEQKADGSVLKASHDTALPEDRDNALKVSETEKGILTARLLAAIALPRFMGIAKKRFARTVSSNEHTGVKVNHDTRFVVDARSGQVRPENVRERAGRRIVDTASKAGYRVLEYLGLVDADRTLLGRKR
ncbi:MAG: hypothetical protein QG629_381 [Patescibacteria group bacterium]|nr:hypothetical protein [Candidatus Saccharibacteria bacterium]MDQ5963299.1 hypothetical protein [Patescibacteria group bacterium]